MLSSCRETTNAGRSEVSFFAIPPQLRQFLILLQNEVGRLLASLSANLFEHCVVSKQWVSPEDADPFSTSKLTKLNELGLLLQPLSWNCLPYPMLITLD